MTKSINVLVIFLVLTSVAFTFVFNKLLSVEHSYKDTWIFRLLLNMIGYATVLLPGLVFYKYVFMKHLDYSESGPVAYLVNACFRDNTRLYSDEKEQAAATAKSSVRQQALLLLFCFVGLQGTYLSWGVLQEKIMTQTYTNSLLETGQFRESQFLVFVNRILACILAGLCLFFIQQPRSTVPLFKFGYSSFTNIMSSWCQYEALKYISFPTQVLAKSCKVIAVMCMGKLVSAKPKKYEMYEYVTAAAISLGMLLFMMSSADASSKVGQATTVSGVILLGLYLICDSFTANWQGVLFESYRVNSLQMMFGTNMFSCLFTTVSLLQQGGFVHSIQFIVQFPTFFVDCVLLSICSAAGQLFVFFTIHKFGPIVFTIIMTIRQGLAILLSCILYSHPISIIGILGIILVLIAVLLQAYCRLRKRAMKKKLNEPAALGLQSHRV